MLGLGHKDRRHSMDESGDTSLKRNHRRDRLAKALLLLFSCDAGAIKRFELHYGYNVGRASDHPTGLQDFSAPFSFQVYGQTRANLGLDRLLQQRQRLSADSGMTIETLGRALR